MARCVTALLMAFVVLAGVAEAQPRAMYQQTQYKGQEIGNLTGDVYYARQDDYLSVFVVTSEGIVLVDPIGTEMATWLKGELARRFKVPVRYVIYSHHHWDHASGGSVWADTARFIGQENMIGHLMMPSAGTPVGLVRPPDITFTDRMTLRLGGKLIEIIARPLPHADDNTLVRFVDGSNVLFASDWITVNRLPFGPITPQETEMARQVNLMDFEHFVGGHAKPGKKADVEANIKYRDELQAAVQKAIAAGQSLEEAQKSVTLDAYRSWEFYEQQRPANVAGFYRALSRR